MFKVNRARLQNNLNIALEALIAHRSRSLLTALGIIFGVAAVISMMAIGRGAKEEILEQIKLIGLNNIVIKPILEQEEAEIGEETPSGAQTKKFSKGLDLKDMFALQKIIPGISAVSPEIEVQSTAIYGSYSRTVRLIGIENSYFPMGNIELALGTYFTDAQRDKGLAVCIIGSDVRAKFFKGQNPIGAYLKVGNNWLQVIGVTARKHVSDQAISNLGLRNYNIDIYAPVQTVLSRYKDRGLMVAGSSQYFRSGNSVMFIDDEDDGNTKNAGSNNYHQIDRLTLQVDNSDNLVESAAIAERALTRMHNNIVDFEITIPEKLLEQQQRTKDIFNIVLSIIAGISLLIGGIGIMNIMLASVLERTREIGTRRALGATKQDIVQQFLLEAILISLSGGIIGIILGISGAMLISKLAGILTIITPVSVFVAFGVAFATGLFFGYRPANNAATQNPIDSLRYE